jgi:uncharacterized protein YecE (DUF72 family)
MGIYIGCAGWSIRSEHREHFAAEGTHLARYASTFNGVEINSSFYRPHRPATYQRWADSTPDGFRFAVKMPRSITHEAQLRDVDSLLDRFLNEAKALGDKLGPLLVQLPPKLAFDAPTVEPFVASLRERFDGAIVCEPRHASWFTNDAEQLLAKFHVGRVAADPACVPEAATPGGWSESVYYRWHGSPKVYYSSYDQSRLETLAAALRSHSATGRDAWCIFDNTALGGATLNALRARELVAK